MQTQNSPLFCGEIEVKIEDKIKWLGQILSAGGLAKSVEEIGRDDYILALPWLLLCSLHRHMKLYMVISLLYVDHLYKILIHIVVFGSK